MSFISYAQNFEDVMLWRALKDVDQGFYIDVGANDPTTDSVTKAFYERGWHGINVEPLTSHYQDLLADRSRDINLCCAAGETRGEIEVFECDIRGWATAAQSVVDKHVQRGHEGVYHRVPLRTLADICQEYVTSDIHFLKIDVEGLEKQVIRGGDFHKFRPWIVVIEATKPNSTEEVHEQWEDLLLAANYQLAYADGLNRFYVAAEHPELLQSLQYPPNVFDGFVLAAQVSAEVQAQQADARAYQAEVKSQQTIHQAEVKAQQAEIKAQQAEAKAQQAEAKAQQAEAKAQQAAAWAQQAEASMSAVCNSHSWRMTRPLRLLGKAVRWFVRGSMAWLTFAPMSRPRRALKSLLISLKNKSNAHPELKALTLRLLSRFPVLKARLINMGNQQGVTSIASCVKRPEQLSPRARQVYCDFKTAIEQQQKDNC